MNISLPNVTEKGHEEAGITTEQSHSTSESLEQFEYDSNGDESDEKDSLGGQESNLSDQTEALTFWKHKQYLEEMNFKYYPVHKDGNCYFRCIAHCIKGTGNSHKSIRREICDYMSKHADLFTEWFGDIESGKKKKIISSKERLKRYLVKLKKVGTWAETHEIRAAQLLYDVNIDVWASFSGQEQTKLIQEQHVEGRKRKIYLFYRGNNHYELLQLKDGDNKEQKEEKHEEVKEITEDEENRIV